MGREVRKVPKNWVHPTDAYGRLDPLLEGYTVDAFEFMQIANKEGLQEAIESIGLPDKNNYMPEWDESEKTQFMMYETTSEGTPISPAFETPAELAQWLVDNNISSFATQEASYEGWLRVAKGGFAPSMVYDGDKLESGVEALFKDQAPE